MSKNEDVALPIIAYGYLTILRGWLAKGGTVVWNVAVHVVTA